MYTVFFQVKAAKLFKKLPLDYQRKIKMAATKLANDPFSLDLKKLHAPYKTSHRLRVGSYRLFLDINTFSKEIIIVDIERRTSQTYR